MIFGEEMQGSLYFFLKINLLPIQSNFSDWKVKMG